MRLKQKNHDCVTYHGSNHSWGLGTWQLSRPKHNPDYPHLVSSLFFFVLPILLNAHCCFIFTSFVTLPVLRKSNNKPLTKTLLGSKHDTSKNFCVLVWIRKTFLHDSQQINLDNRLIKIYLYNVFKYCRSWRLSCIFLNMELLKE